MSTVPSGGRQKTNHREETRPRPKARVQGRKSDSGRGLSVCLSVCLSVRGRSVFGGSLPRYAVGAHGDRMVWPVGFQMSDEVTRAMRRTWWSNVRLGLGFWTHVGDK